MSMVLLARLTAGCWRAVGMMQTVWLWDLRSGVQLAGAVHRVRDRCRLESGWTPAR
jgi:hypothetical protein